MSLFFDFFQHIEIHLSRDILFPVEHNIVDKLLRQGTRTWIQAKFFVGKLFFSHE